MVLVSPHPFWSLKNGLLGVYPTLKADERCAVAVLGAGITGALMAYALVKAGLEVVVVDKREVASGSTAASTALLQYEIDTPLTELIERLGQTAAEQAHRVCLESITRIEELVAELGDPCGFERKQSVYLATKRGDVDDLRAEHQARQKAGIRVDFFEAGEVAGRFSFQRPAALLSHDGAQVDAFRLAHRLLARAQQMGARIYDRTEIEDYDARADGVTLTARNGVRIDAQFAVSPPAAKSSKSCQSAW